MPPGGWLQYTAAHEGLDKPTFQQQIIIYYAVSYKYTLFPRCSEV